MAQPDLIGKTFGKYQVLEELGRGGMGIVYKAYDPNLDRFVAIKILAPHLVWEPGFVTRFLQEARAAAKLEHPNIVVVYDSGEQDGIYYIVMQYVDGKPLNAILQEQGPLPAERVARIVEQMAWALETAHRRGLVHRDVKPSNILVRTGDRVVLTDFGIARALTGTGFTSTGRMVGTPGYVSPEQIRGQEVGPAADQYGLGLVAYELLVGRPPFEGDVAALLHAHAYQAPPPLRTKNPQVTEAVEAAVLRTLAKEPEERWGSVDEFARQLKAAILKKDVRISRRKKEITVPLWLRTLPNSMAWGLGAVVVVVLVAASLHLLRGNPPPTPTTVVEVPTSVSTQTPPPTWTRTPKSTDVPEQVDTVTSTATSTSISSPMETSTSRPVATSTPKPPPKPVLQAKIAFSAAKPNAEPDIYTMNPDGSGVTQLTFDPGYDSGPDWSPDGKYIAFHSNRKGNYDIYVMDRAGERVSLRQLTSHPGNDYDASWSPDGKQIVFMSERDGNREIYVMDSDGSNVQRLTNTAASPGAPSSERQPDWSPQGSYIAFESRRGGNPQIYLMRPDGGEQHAITNSVGQNLSPKWSPDGRWIVFASTRDPENKEKGWTEIYIADVSGGQQIRLTNNSADDEAPGWSPDGQWIVLATKRYSCPGQTNVADCDWDLVVMARDGSDVRRLTNTPDLSEHNPVWWAP